MPMVEGARGLFVLIKLWQCTVPKRLRQNAPFNVARLEAIIRDTRWLVLLSASITQWSKLQAEAIYPSNNGSAGSPRADKELSFRGSIAGDYPIIRTEVGDWPTT